MGLRSFDSDVDCVIGLAIGSCRELGMVEVQLDEVGQAKYRLFLIVLGTDWGGVSSPKNVNHMLFYAIYFRRYGLFNLTSDWIWGE